MDTLQSPQPVSLNPKPTPNDDQGAAWKLILSSSVALAVITGVFYLVGGADYIGYADALGLSYLAGPQSNEYIFDGGRILLDFSFANAFGVVALVALPTGSFISAKIKDWRIPRHFELSAFLLFVFASVLSSAFFLLHQLRGYTSLTSGYCPIPSSNSGQMMTYVTAFMIATTGFLFRFFTLRHLRFMVYIQGAIISLFCLYHLGVITGRGKMYGPFQVAEITNTSLLAGVNTQVLVLGSDANNLVVLVPGENYKGHPEPRYLLRSEVKSFRLIGTSSINDFFCKRTQAISK